MIVKGKEILSSTSYTTLFSCIRVFCQYQVSSRYYYTVVDCIQRWNLQKPVQKYLKGNSALNNVPELVMVNALTIVVVGKCSMHEMHLSCA